MISLITKSLSLLAFLSLSSCAKASFLERLPDDPDSEQVSSQPLDLAEEKEMTLASPIALLEKYDHLDPQRLINTKALAEAVVYFDKNQSRIKNRNYMSLIDFSKRSTEPRFFIVDMISGSVWPIRTAHGKGSDSNHDGVAEKFSDKSGSNASSLGYYLAAETYIGKHGLSLRLDGLSGTNSAARARAVVIHGASYVKEAPVIQGRSWGCPAIAMHFRDRVLNMLKGGSLIYAFTK